MKWRRWTHRMSERLGDRAAFSVTELHGRYFSQLPESEFAECCQFISQEWGIDPGKLRPDDRVEEVLGPVQTSNPVLWIFYRGRGEDRLSELEYRLAKRQRSARPDDGPRAKIVTVADLMAAWCHQPS